MVRNDLQTLSFVKIASLCGVGRTTVQRWVRDGKIKSLKRPSRHTCVKVEDFIDFLNEYHMPIPQELFSDC